MKQAMIILGFSLFTLAGCGSTPTSQPAGASSNQSAQTEEQVTTTVKTCHEQHRTGSRMAKRSCKS